MAAYIQIDLQVQDDTAYSRVVQANVELREARVMEKTRNENLYAAAVALALCVAILLLVFVVKITL